MSCTATGRGKVAGRKAPEVSWTPRGIKLSLRRASAKAAFGCDGMRKKVHAHATLGDASGPRATLSVHLGAKFTVTVVDPRARERPHQT